MKTNIKSKWLVVLILMLSVSVFAQTSKSGNRPGVTLPGQNEKQTSQILTYGPDESSEWIHYDNNCENCDSWGFLISGEIYDIVAKWDPSDLTNYDEWVITQVKFIVVTNNPIIKVKVWEGPSFTEVYSQDVPTYNVNSWTTVILDTPVEIDASTELYVGYYVDYSMSELGGFVTATDNGPAVDEYGNLCRWNGNWYSDFNNHNLQVLIESNLNAAFDSDVTTVCEGGTVNYTNLSTGENSWLWTFDGGTPATSTDENPTVTYSIAGVYDVTLTVSDGVENSTYTAYDYVSVVVTPDQADVPTGDDELCSGLIYEYSINPVVNAATYDWAVTPETAGTFIGNGTTVDFEVAETYSGSFTINVRAWNVCDYGPWSDDFNGTVYSSPLEFEVLGNGEICEGDAGIEISLSGSELGVDYELFNNEGTTGIIVSGTGEPISFGLFTEENNYTAVGFTDHCSSDMIGEGSILVNQYPEQPTMPAGPDEVCNRDENVYTTSNTQETDEIIWTLSPEEAGTLSSAGPTAYVSWNNNFEGDALLSVYAVNSCGAGPESEFLEIVVYAGTTPEISGDDLVCKNEVSVYSTSENSESIYSWEVIGGSITEGDETSEIAVTWGDTSGEGYVIVTESLEFGCSTIDSLVVNIDDCTGIENNMFSNDFRVYPNPAQSMLNFDFLAKKGEKIEISIFNSLGQLVMQKQEIASGEKQSSSFNIENLPKGLYVIHAKTSKQTIWQSKIDKF